MFGRYVDSEVSKNSETNADEIFETSEACENYEKQLVCSEDM